MHQKDYREIAAIPTTKPYVSHMQYKDSQGQSVTLFPAFRSVDTVHDISRIQSPIKLNTVPLITRNQDKWANQYHEIVREYRPSKDEPESLFLFGKDELYRSESSGDPLLKPQMLHVSTESPQAPTPAPINPNPPPAPPLPPPLPPRKTSNKYPFTRQPSFRQTYPRMRYIYAFPEEFRDWIAQPTFSRFPPPPTSNDVEYQPSEAGRKPRSSVRRPIPIPRRSFEEKKKLPQYENIPINNNNSTQKSIVEEIKEKIKNKKAAASVSAVSGTTTILKRKKELVKSPMTRKTTPSIRYEEMLREAAKAAEAADARYLNKGDTPLKREILRARAPH